MGQQYWLGKGARWFVRGEGGKRDFEALLKRLTEGMLLLKRRRRRRREGEKLEQLVIVSLFVAMCKIDSKQ